MHFIQVFKNSLAGETQARMEDEDQSQETLESPWGADEDMVQSASEAAMRQGNTNWSQSIFHRKNQQHLLKVCETGRR